MAFSGPERNTFDTPRSGWPQPAVVDTVIEDLDRLMEEAGIDAVLMYGNAFTTPDVFWLTGFRSSDEVIVLRNRGEDTVVAAGFNTLERVRKESTVRRTFDTSEIMLQLIAENKRLMDDPAAVFGSVLKELFSGDVIGVPTHLPAHILVALQDLGYKVKVVPYLLTEARATKSPREVEMIRKAGRATIGAVQHVIDLIAETTVGPNKVLLRDGQPLTVGDIKSALDHFLLDRRAETAEDTIVAVGRLGFDWHYLGSPDDRLHAEVPIIIDVFPRLKLERYVADVTRTVVRGSVPPELRRMFDAVSEAHSAAADALSEGALMDEVNMACYDTLRRYGFDSTRLNPRAEEGMTHSLGHGIGLFVHELPTFYRYSDRLERGHVLAVEPGVYLRQVGGVRIENDYVVSGRRAERLTSGLDDVQFV